jgi:DNA-binding HxlR family transcriptional regulator
MSAILSTPPWSHFGTGGPCRRRRPADYGVGSPTRLGLECLTHKWTPLIVFALEQGPLRFTELRKAVRGVTAQVLTRSLRALERDGIVVRRYFPEVPPGVEHGLTDLGVTLCEPVGAIRAWGEKYGEAILTARQRYEHSKAEDEGTQRQGDRCPGRRPDRLSGAATRR